MRRGGRVGGVWTNTDRAILDRVVHFLYLYITLCKPYPFRTKLFRGKVQWVNCVTISLHFALFMLGHCVRELGGCVVFVFSRSRSLM